MDDYVRPVVLSEFQKLSTDLKREIYERTAGWRGTEGNNRILRFEPASSSHSVRFNPLDEIRIGTEHETGDIQNLANLIVDPDGKGLQTHWQNSPMVDGAHLDEIFELPKATLDLT